MRRSDYLSSTIGASNDNRLKRTVFTANAAVQTDAIITNAEPQSRDDYEQEHLPDTRVGQDGLTSLSSSDLTNILQWSQDISRDINLSSGKLFHTSPFAECSRRIRSVAEIARNIHE